jgi:hypothetical protein
MQSRVQQALKDGLAGVVFVAIGLAFAFIGQTYALGTTGQMGPGYFPTVLGVILVVLGGAIVVQAFLSPDLEREPFGRIPWRALAMTLAAVMVFGLTVRGLGVAPAVFLSALLSALSSRTNSPLAAAAIGIGLAVLGVLIFIVALSLRLPLVGPWLGG